jgi:hypothetical protein
MLDTFKATNTHSEYVILIPFPRQRLRESALNVTFICTLPVSRTRADHKCIFPCCSANFRVVFDSHLDNTCKRVAQTCNSKSVVASVQRPALRKYTAAKRITLQVTLLQSCYFSVHFIIYSSNSTQHSS